MTLAESNLPGITVMCANSSMMSLSKRRSFTVISVEFAELVEENSLIIVMLAICAWALVQKEIINVKLTGFKMTVQSAWNKCLARAMLQSLSDAGMPCTQNALNRIRKQILLVQYAESQLQTLHFLRAISIT